MINTIYQTEQAIAKVIDMIVINENTTQSVDSGSVPKQHVNVPEFGSLPLRTARRMVCAQSITICDTTS